MAEEGSEGSKQENEQLILTSQSLCKSQCMHRGPVVRCVLRLLRRLLVKVVHGAQ